MLGCAGYASGSHGQLVQPPGAQPGAKTSVPLEIAVEDKSGPSLSSSANFSLRRDSTGLTRTQFADETLPEIIRDGDWILAATYIIFSDAAPLPFSVKLRAAGARLRPLTAPAAWAVSDDSFLSLSDSSGELTTLTIMGPGEGTVSVSSGGVSRAMTVTVTEVKGRAFKVVLSRK